MWGFVDSEGKSIPPRVYTDGRSQEDIIEEVLNELKKNDIVFLKGGVGTGKSVIGLSVISSYGTGIVVTPTKILEDQYVNDYCTNRFRIIDNYGTALEAYPFKGKNNFRCRYHKGFLCGNKDTVCSRKLEDHESRIVIASDCPYWSPVYSFIPDTIGKWLPEHNRFRYDSITGERSYYRAPDPCEYFDQFYYFTKECAMIMNLAKWEIETWIGRKARVPIEIIDEGDDFLDSLKYKVVISKRYFESISREGLVPLGKIKYLEFLFDNLIEKVRDYDYYMDDVIGDYLEKFISTLAGESTSGRVCDFVNRLGLMLRHRNESWIRVYRGILTAFIPRPDITLEELKHRSGKMLIMSATIHRSQVLKGVFGIGNPVIVEAESKFPGLLFIKETGKEQNVTAKNWNDEEFKRDYWKTLDEIISMAKRPTLIQVHAFKYVPDKYKENINEWRNNIMFSTTSDRGLDLVDDKCRSIVIMKYPLPDISDIMFLTMKKQLGDGRFWSYLTDLADRNLVQQCGRAVRNDNDWCEVYTLDKKVISRLKALWRGRYSIEDLSKRLSQTKISGFGDKNR